MKNLQVLSSVLAAALPVTLGCDSCYGPINHIEHVRHVKRIQPGAQNADCGPSRALEWGQFNVLHTTDTHGWLAGHIKEKNYGADLGDYVTFANHMKHKAGNMGVDLLIVDTGDLHDGTGLSDTTAPDGEVAIKIFEELDSYDLLTIGNHELYVSDVAYQTFSEFSRFWGDRYLTSNVQIMNPATGGYEYIGQTHRYFTTAHGLRIMAFGILYDFTGNSNASKAIKAATMVQQDWFLQAVNYDKDRPIDMFLLLGHNPARPTTGGSTFKTVYNAIRKVHPNTPIQIFGGHTHIRDFAVLDQSSTSLESGRYCETLGWFSMSGFDSLNSGHTGVENPRGVPNPTRKAITNSSSTTSPFVYSRRYLDWNRNTFVYHAVGSGQADAEFDYHSGLRVTDEIAAYRKQLNLGKVYGCVPQTYCMTCVPFGDASSIFTPLSDALATAVVSPAREARARMVIANTGGVRFDMYKGPFTYDDSFIVSPFRDVFLYIPDVPYSLAGGLLQKLNNAGAGGKKKRSNDLGAVETVDSCVNPIAGRGGQQGDGSGEKRGITRRQVVQNPGYTTVDDFGSDGDDTPHSSIPYYPIPDFFAGVANYPEAGSPQVVDVVFVDFIESDVLAILGSGYSKANVTPYVSSNFTSQDYLIPYVQAKWQAGMPNCPI
ncbi:Metallo-dependent phosphatase-like protein [Diplogelasinospora grovesii]|uniref:Metallo-dependent phosphatase-like protein n=1 Tax=Diplogelasinospora grovesii TaxID=303347 RepID=A0AAN6S5E8_9PEZI|nr:Metallo-dependent phosphatase-like protein [Diplogelasinospora grovesii]